MRSVHILIVVGLVSMWQVLALSSESHNRNIPREQDTARLKRVGEQKQAELNTKQNRFRRAQALLDNKHLGLDVEALTVPNWRENLAETFAQMPEMQSVRYESKPLEGVVITDTLYLPEEVVLADDALILTRDLVFEGSRAVIRGNHNIIILPVNGIHVTGATMSSLNMSAGRARDSLAAWKEIQGFTKKPKSGTTSLTIDTSWYPDTQPRKPKKGARASSFQIMEDRSGIPGADGTDGVPGSNGFNGAPGNPGSSGVCFWYPNGGIGSPGANGTWGNEGTRGGDGGPGGNGGDIWLELSRDDTGTYNEISRGGPGGNGGNGGNGGDGGFGGNGGNGGDGGDCSCSDGGQGSGGNGGAGGAGGHGSDGSNGGNGGRGGNSGLIHVSYQCELVANISYDYTAGTGGNPGYGGMHGYGGLGGQAGLGGNKGGGECPVCPSEYATRGNDGTAGPSGSNGLDGSQGTIGANGISQPPEEVGVSIDCDGGGGGGGGGGCTDHWQCWDVYYCECYWYELSHGSGDITPQYWDCYCTWLYTYCDYLGCW